jgi:hypothetical protein
MAIESDTAVLLDAVPPRVVLKTMIFAGLLY